MECNSWGVTTEVGYKSLKTSRGFQHQAVTKPFRGLWKTFLVLSGHYVEPQLQSLVRFLVRNSSFKTAFLSGMKTQPDTSL